MNSKINDNKKPTEITTLKVAEAEQRDVGRKIARVDPEVARRLNITSGDALEIIFTWKKNYSFKLAGEGKRQNKGLIRIDGHQEIS